LKGVQMALTEQEKAEIRRGVTEGKLFPWDLELPEYVTYDGIGWKVVMVDKEEIRLAATDGSGRVALSSVTALRLALENDSIQDDDLLDLSKIPQI
jgi:hypothetical protein